MCVLNEAILMSTHNIYFHDKLRNSVRKNTTNDCFLNRLEELP